MNILKKLFNKKEKLSLEEYINNNEDKNNYKIIENDLLFIFSIFLDNDLNQFKKIENIIKKNINIIFDLYLKIEEKIINNYFLKKQYSYSFIKNFNYFYIMLFLIYIKDKNKIFEYLKNNFNLYIEKDYLFDPTYDWNLNFKYYYNLEIKNETFYNYLIYIIKNNSISINNFENILFNINLLNLDKTLLEYILNKINIKIIENEEFLIQNIDILNLLLKKKLNKNIKEKYFKIYIEILYLYYMYNNNLDFLIEGLKENNKYLSLNELSILIKTFGKKITNNKKYFYMLNKHKEDENNKYLNSILEEIKKKESEKKESYSCHINKKLEQAKKIQEIKKLKNKYRTFNIKNIKYNNTDFYLLLCISLDKKTYFNIINNNLDNKLYELYLKTYFKEEQYLKLLEIIGQLKNKDRYRNFVKYIINNSFITDEDLKNEKILKTLDLLPKLKASLINKSILELNNKKLTFNIIENKLNNNEDIIYQIYSYKLLPLFTDDNIIVLKEYYKTNYKKFIEETNDFDQLGQKKYNYSPKDLENMKHYYL